MTPELSPGLLGAEIELADRERPASIARPPGATVDAPAERLSRHSVLTYAVTDGADAYRRIMRILYDEHQAFGLRLRPAQVRDRLRERYGLTVDVDWLDERLKALSTWGAAERDHDAGLATSASEWRRNRYTYDVTPAGRLTEELLARLDALGEEIGRLDMARLPSIRDALAKLAEQAPDSHADGTELRSLFERVLAEVELLHKGALTFMRSLSDLMQAVEQVGEAEFERGKGALLEHLQGFKRSRMQYSAEILGLLEEIERDDPAALVSRIVASETFVALPGGASIEDQRARRTAELMQRWHGLRAWFVGDEDSASPWRTLNDQVVEAIRTVLAIAERLIERRSARIDRAGVFLHLAARAAAAQPGEATAWVRAAFGLRSPRHIGVISGSGNDLEPSRVSWRAAEPAPVVAHLRNPGVRRPGTGRGAQVADLTESRRRLEARRAAERAELAAVLERFGAEPSLTLSRLESVNLAEFRHLLQWIGRAYESPADGDGARRASSIDGRATIILHLPPHPRTARTRLHAPHGSLELPDYRIEVAHR
jgi:uncharacterized protein (TIGR02677 family)